MEVPSEYFEKMKEKEWFEVGCSLGERHSAPTTDRSAVERWVTNLNGDMLACEGEHTVETVEF